MSIKTVAFDECVMRCDCGDCDLQLVGIDFDHVRQQAKRQNWRTFKELNGWVNLAPGHEVHL